uniref:Secreted protein n=1 Tax=Opuntia streptacantha TaxID=393608 RepID=A0A7C8YEJ4_OPUST
MILGAQVMLAVLMNPRVTGLVLRLAVDIIHPAVAHPECPMVLQRSLRRNYRFLVAMKSSMIHLRWTVMRNVVMLTNIPKKRLKGLLTRNPQSQMRSTTIWLSRMA